MSRSEGLHLRNAGAHNVCCANRPLIVQGINSYIAAKSAYTVATKYAEVLMFTKSKVYIAKDVYPSKTEGSEETLFHMLQYSVAHCAVGSTPSIHLIKT